MDAEEAIQCGANDRGTLKRAEVSVPVAEAIRKGRNQRANILPVEGGVCRPGGGPGSSDGAAAGAADGGTDAGQDDVTRQAVKKMVKPSRRQERPAAIEVPRSMDSVAEANPRDCVGKSALRISQNPHAVEQAGIWASIYSRLQASIGCFASFRSFQRDGRPRYAV